MLQDVDVETYWQIRIYIYQSPWTMYYRTNVGMVEEEFPESDARNVTVLEDCEGVAMLFDKALKCEEWLTE